MATIASLASSVTNRLHSRYCELLRDRISPSHPLKAICILSVFLSSRQWTKSPGFHSKVLGFVAVRADQFQVVFVRITRVVVAMVSLKYLWNFVVAASITCISKFLSRKPTLPFQSSAYTIISTDSPLLTLVVALAGAESLCMKFVALTPECFAALWANAVHGLPFCPRLMALSPYQREAACIPAWLGTIRWQCAMISCADANYMLSALANDVDVF